MMTACEVAVSAAVKDPRESPIFRAGLEVGYQFTVFDGKAVEMETDRVGATAPKTFVVGGTHRGNSIGEFSHWRM